VLENLAVYAVKAIRYCIANLTRTFSTQRTNPDYSLASNDQGTSPPDRRQWTYTLRRPANLSSGADTW
jgi:hypothetical protein